MSEKLTNDEVRAFARRMVRREVFTTWNMAPVDQHDVSVLRMIFMPLALMSQEIADQMLEEEAEIFYAPLAHAGPTSINGYPTFFELAYLTRQDAPRVWAAYEGMEALINGEPDETAD